MGFFTFLLILREWENERMRSITIFLGKEFV